MATRNAAFTATFLAWDTSANAPKTGDSANITPRILKDGTSAALGTATVTEVDATNFPGLYKVTVAQSEADFSQVVVGGSSSTANIEIIPTTYQMERLPDAAPDGAGGLPISDAGGLDLDARLDAAVSSRATPAQVATELGTYDGPTNAEMIARTLVAADYFDPAADAVANVTLVATTTTNTDMRGTDSAALASAWTATRAGYVDELAAANIPADVDTILARLTAARAGYLDNLSAGAVATATALATVDTNVDAVLVDTADMQPKIGTPAADLAQDIANLNDPTAATIADAVWDEAQTGHVTAGTFGKYLDTEVSGVGGGSAASIADAVWEETLADHSGTAGSTAEALAAISAPASQTYIDGMVYRSGSDYFWIADLRVDGSVVTSGISSPAVVGAYGNNGETDLGYSVATAPTVGTNHSIYGAFSLGTTPTTGVPWFLEVTAVYGGSTYRARLRMARDS